MTFEFWQWPWRFRQHNIILAALVGLGFLAEYFSPVSGVPVPAAPYNVYLGLFLTVVIIGIYSLRLFQRYVRWLLSFQFVVTAVSWLGILSVMSGLVPKDAALPLFWQQLGFNGLTQSVPYAVLLLLICQSLLLASLKRLKSFSLLNISFLLNHLGLYIVLVAAALGSGDLMRLKMDLPKGKFVQEAYQHRFGEKIKMPFALRLREFELKTYPPKLLVLSKTYGEVVKDFTIFPKTGGAVRSELKLQDWDLTFHTYYDEAVPQKGAFAEKNIVGSSPALQVTVRDKVNQKTVGGWISSGSFRYPAQTLAVNQEFSLALENPQPRRYRSEIDYLTAHGNGTFSVLVNQPHALAGWQVYQYGYDAQKGKWSQQSIVEVVRDPWLPVVYTGLYMLMAGSLLMLVCKRKNG